MKPAQNMRCTAFAGFQRIAAGELATVALETKRYVDQGERIPVVVFDDVTSEQVELDLRGTPDDVLRRLTAVAQDAAADTHSPEVRPAPRGPGRPKLGVVAREVTLLPRHWEWLNRQPGGASVALRKLVDEARRVYVGADQVRHAQEAAYRFVSVVAGDLPGFEEVTRALFARDRDRFEQYVQLWPNDVRDHAQHLAAGAFGEHEAPGANGR